MPARTISPPGMSVGRESGSETTQRYAGETSVRTSVACADYEVEGLVRLGVAFDL